jgi:hypothetical protein
MITQNTLDTDIPTIIHNPLDANAREERIRKALGIAWGPLPDVQPKWLRRYHEHLGKTLTLPFRADYAEDIAGYRQLISPVTVIGLVDPTDHDRPEEVGLLCRAKRGEQTIELPLADIELAENSRNSRLLDDYWYWFWNWHFAKAI